MSFMNHHPPETSPTQSSEAEDSAFERTGFNALHNGRDEEENVAVTGARDTNIRTNDEYENSDGVRETTELRGVPSPVKTRGREKNDDNAVRREDGHVMEDELPEVPPAMEGFTQTGACVIGRTHECAGDARKDVASMMVDGEGSQNNDADRAQLEKCQESVKERHEDASSEIDGNAKVPSLRGRETNTTEEGTIGAREVQKDDAQKGDERDDAHMENCAPSEDERFHTPMKGCMLKKIAQRETLNAVGTLKEGGGDPPLSKNVVEQSVPCVDTRDEAWMEAALLMELGGHEAATQNSMPEDPEEGRHGASMDGTEHNAKERDETQMKGKAHIENETPMKNLKPQLDEQDKTSMENTPYELDDRNGKLVEMCAFHRGEWNDTQMVSNAPQVDKWAKKLTEDTRSEVNERDEIPTEEKLYDAPIESNPSKETEMNEKSAEDSAPQVDKRDDALMNDAPQCSGLGETPKKDNPSQDGNRKELSLVETGPKDVERDETSVENNTSNLDEREGVFAEDVAPQLCGQNETRIEDSLSKVSERDETTRESSALKKGEWNETLMEKNASNVDERDGALMEDVAPQLDVQGETPIEDSLHHASDRDKTPPGNDASKVGKRVGEFIENVAPQFDVQDETTIKNSSPQVSERNETLMENGAVEGDDEQEHTLNKDERDKRLKSNLVPAEDETANGAEPSVDPNASLEDDTARNSETPINLSALLQSETSMLPKAPREEETPRNMSALFKNEAATETKTSMSQSTLLKNETAAGTETSMEPSASLEDDTAKDAETNMNRNALLKNETAAGTETSMEPSASLENDTAKDAETNMNRNALLKNETAAGTETSMEPSASLENDTAKDAETPINRHVLLKNETAAETETSMEPSASLEDDTAKDAETNMNRNALLKNKTATGTEVSMERGASLENDTAKDAETNMNQNALLKNKTAAGTEISMEASASLENDTAKDAETPINRLVLLKSETATGTETSMEPSASLENDTAKDAETPINRHVLLKNETATDTKSFLQSHASLEEEISKETETPVEPAASIEDDTAKDAETRMNPNASLEGEIPIDPSCLLKSEAVFASETPMERSASFKDDTAKDAETPKNQRASPENDASEDTELTTMYPNASLEVKTPTAAELGVKSGTQDSTCLQTNFTNVREARREVLQAEWSQVSQVDKRPFSSQQSSSSLLPASQKSASRMNKRPLCSQPSSSSIPAASQEFEPCVDKRPFSPQLSSLSMPAASQESAPRLDKVPFSSQPESSGVSAPSQKLAPRLSRMLSSSQMDSPSAVSSSQKSARSVARKRSFSQTNSPAPLPSSQNSQPSLSQQFKTRVLAQRNKYSLKCTYFTPPCRGQRPFLTQMRTPNELRRFITPEDLELPPSMSSQEPNPDNSPQPSCASLILENRFASDSEDNFFPMAQERSPDLSRHGSNITPTVPSTRKRKKPRTLADCGVVCSSPSHLQFSQGLPRIVGPPSPTQSEDGVPLAPEEATLGEIDNFTQIDESMAPFMTRASAAHDDLESYASQVYQERDDDDDDDPALLSVKHDVDDGMPELLPLHALNPTPNREVDLFATQVYTENAADLSRPQAERTPVGVDSFATQVYVDNSATASPPPTRGPGAGADSFATQVYVDSSATASAPPTRASGADTDLFATQVYVDNLATASLSPAHQPGASADLFATQVYVDNSANAFPPLADASGGGIDLFATQAFLDLSSPPPPAQSRSVSIPIHENTQRFDDLATQRYIFPSSGAEDFAQVKSPPLPSQPSAVRPSIAKTPLPVHRSSVERMKTAASPSQKESTVKPKNAVEPWTCSFELPSKRTFSRKRAKLTLGKAKIVDSHQIRRGPRPAPQEFLLQERETMNVNKALPARVGPAGNNIASVKRERESMRGASNASGTPPKRSRVSLGGASSTDGLQPERNRASLGGASNADGPQPKRGRASLASAGSVESNSIVSAPKQKDARKSVGSVASRKSRKRKVEQVRGFLISGFKIDDLNSKVKSQLEDLGAQFYDEWNSKVTHMVVPAELYSFKRTKKILCSISRSLPIVSFNYLLQCAAVDSLDVDETAYLRFEEELRSVKQKAKVSRLLKNYAYVYMFPTIKDRASHSGIIEAAGSTFRLSYPPKEKIQDSLFLGTETDVGFAKKHKIKLYSLELLLEGVFNQKLEFNQFKLWA